jgi:gluconolactonase
MVARSFDFKPNQRYADPSVEIVDPSFIKYRIHQFERKPSWR